MLCMYLQERVLLGETKLEHDPIEQDVGILISHYLSWNHHIDVISSKAQRILNLLYRTCKYTTDIRMKKLLYITWVQSPYTKRNITNLEQIQRRATRFILGKEFTEYKCPSKLNLLP